MAYDSSKPKALSVKILVAGGFGVGKTTFVTSISEIPALQTEEVMTAASVGVDSLEGVPDKITTTVAMDFGRFTIPGARMDMVVYLFGTPGQDRFWFVWDDLAHGALGAVVLADTRRLDDCFEAVDYFERRRIKFLLAVNQFDGAFHYSDQELRDALRLSPHVPVRCCDARERGSVVATLTALVEHLLAQTGASSRPAHPEPARPRSRHER